VRAEKAQGKNNGTHVRLSNLFAERRHAKGTPPREKAAILVRWSRFGGKAEKRRVRKSTNRQRLLGNGVSREGPGGVPKQHVVRAMRPDDVGEQEGNY